LWLKKREDKERRDDNPGEQERGEMLRIVCGKDKKNYVVLRGKGKKEPYRGRLKKKKKKTPTQNCQGFTGLIENGKIALTYGERAWGKTLRRHKDGQSHYKGTEGKLRWECNLCFRAVGGIWDL